MRINFIGQVYLHIRGICYSDRSSTVQQNDSNRTGHRQNKNNIHIGNVQNSKNTIYNIDNYVCTGLICANLKLKISMCDEYIIYYSVVCSTFNVKCSWDGLLGERNCFCVWSFWCSEFWSVDQTVTVQRVSVLMWGVQSDFSSPFAHSGWVQFLESGEGCSNDLLTSPDYPP